MNNYQKRYFDIIYKQYGVRLWRGLHVWVDGKIGYEKGQE